MIQISHDIVEFIRTIALTVLLALSLPALADLEGRAPLTPGGTDYRAWYDTQLGITWLANANLAATSKFGVMGISAAGRMDWSTGNVWVDAMNQARYLGVNTWRLPVTRPINGFAYNYTSSFNGSTDPSYNVGGPGTAYAGSGASEMSHLYYNTLGNLGYCAPTSTAACTPQTAYGPVTKAPFTNLITGWYWSGTSYGADPSKAWFFAFDDGSQWGPSKLLTTLHVWPVADGDVLASATELCPAGVTTPDTDGDGIPDICDSCTLVANPGQTDSDRDGFGNRCDGDFNDNGFTNAQDAVLLRSKLGSNDPAFDLNGNGFVNAQDVTILRSLLGKPSGPSGRRSNLTAFQSTPASGFAERVPVVLINFIPTINGTHIDSSVWEGRPWPPPTEWGESLLISDVRSYVSDITDRVKFTLEEGSRFRGYKTSAAPYLGYQVVEIYNFYLPLPGARPYPGQPEALLPDMHKIMSWIPAKRLVEQVGVREFWVNGHEGWGPGMVIVPESNMSSLLTGDVSNSHRVQDDLPVFANSYVVYGTDYLRSQSEAVHNHGHQIEAMLSHANQLQDGNTNLFWKSFVGQNNNGQFITGRCGWTHMPPNTIGNYDYYNSTLVLSDCENWRPDGAGQKTSVNSATWTDKFYNWPTATPFPQQGEAQFYIYWMQNMPGAGNQIPYGATTMENWWSIIGDWDDAMSVGKGLHH